VQNRLEGYYGAEYTGLKILHLNKGLRKQSDGGGRMKRFFMGFAAMVIILSLAGCAELKQLRIETTEQKAAIARMDTENRTCQDALKQNRDQLMQREVELDAVKKELDVAKSQLELKEVKVKEQSDAFTRMQEAMKAELASKQVALAELEGKLTLTMVESILFDSGKAEVKPEGMEALKKVAEVLRNTADQEIVIAGHTDNVPIIGMLARTYPTNWELSAARAISVVKLLVADGVDPIHLSAAGYSEYRPVEDNGTPEGRAKNRRMEIILMPKRN